MSRITYLDGHGRGVLSHSQSGGGVVNSPPRHVFTGIHTHEADLESYVEYDEGIGDYVVPEVEENARFGDGRFRTTASRYLS